jgi:hypothetical protein
MASNEIKIGSVFSYELSDGQIRSEEGAYKDGLDVDGNAVKILVVQGAYSWNAPGIFRFFDI